MALPGQLWQQQLAPGLASHAIVPPRITSTIPRRFAGSAHRSTAKVLAVSSVQLQMPTVTPKPASVPTKYLWSTPSGQPASLTHGPAVRGRADPLGASLDASTNAINFAIFSSTAKAVSLVLFSEADLQAGRTTLEVALDPVLNRTGDVWHIMLPNLDEDLLYGYRLSGLHQDEDPLSPGHRHDETRVVLDPYAQAVLSRRKWGQLGPPLDYQNPKVLGFTNTWPQAAAALPSRHQYDWDGDRPLNLPMEQLIIYETHVRGFTAHPSSGVRAPGTYAGMTERLDYLQSLGVTAIELMPMHEFNELEYYSLIPGSSSSYRYNFWGYSTTSFFAPMSRFSARVANGAPIRAAQDEFKTLVKECHKRGIEVILDVVFNHTAEGNEMGPTISFRGLDNRVYYMLAPGGEYYNYSGCGNTLNCNQPVVRQLILDCLKHWVTEYHVDGFRFDLASILTRAQSSWHPEELDEEGARVALHSGGAIVNEDGNMTDGAGVPTGTPLPDPPVVEMISEDPILRNTKMIAEAWDCDGLHQVGAFPHYGGRWAEWNGRFRDTVRQFIKGTEGPWAGAFASALCGSPNMYSDTSENESDWWGSNGGRKWKGGRGPTASINFVSAHDGFTLADMVSYNEKHNEANGENNRDGEAHNLTWNCGEEGPSREWSVNRLRQRQMRNISVALMLSHGVPMLVMGDEYGHTKNGNNNTYCHDSPLNWFDWRAAADEPTGFARFMRLLINFRRTRVELQRSTFVTDREIRWHGELPDTPDWTEESRLVAYTLREHTHGNGLFVAFNTSHLPKVLKMPNWGSRVWRPVIDTGKVAPYDFLQADSALSAADVAAAVAANSMYAGEGVVSMLPYSCVVLESVVEDSRTTLMYKHSYFESGAANLMSGTTNSRSPAAAAMAAPDGPASAWSPPPSNTGRTFANFFGGGQ